jgi:transcriptional regulator with XRE-family HTH domain
MTTDLGERLRQIRQKRGLSQRELAKRAGVTSATISLIEQNRVSPSVASLKKVLDGLSLSLAEFFASADPAARPRIFYRAAELVELGSDSLSLRQVGENLKGQTLQILHERHQPGSDSGEYSHEGHEGGVIVRGHLEITVGGQTTVLGPGDAYLFDSTTRHRMRNTGKKVCEVVSACTPPTF